MNPRNTWILILLVAALCAFIFYIQPRYLRPAPAKPVKVMPTLKPDDITSIQLLLPGQKEIRVDRTNGGWWITEPLSYPALSPAIENLVRIAAVLGPQTRISAQELQGRLTVNEEFGFVNAQATIVFNQGNDHPTLQLGSLTPPGDGIYAQVVGTAGIDIIDADFFRKLVPRNVNEWRDPSLVILTNINFNRLTVSGASQAFELRRERTNQTWRMTKPVQSRADYPKIDSLLDALQNTYVTSFVTDDARADLESFGLQPAALELRFDDNTNQVLALQFGKSPTNDDKHIYARLAGQNSVLLLPREHISPWAGGFQEFRDRHLARFADGPPDVIEVFGPPENFTIQRNGEKSWNVTKPMELPADTNIMRNFLDSLTGIEVVRVNNSVAVDDAALPDSYGLATPSRRYVLKHNGSVIAELDFGTNKDGNIFVRRADRPEESSVYAIKLDDFKKLPAAALQLRSRPIWSFSVTNVTQVTIRLGGKDEKITRVGEGDWKLAAGSQGLFNTLEVEMGADELGVLAAENWIQRGDADRARYGFTDQSLQISVEVKSSGKPEALKVDFGGISPHGLRYGDVRMEDGQNWIFEFPAIVIDRLTEFFNIHENRGP